MLPLSENALDEMVARERDRGAPALTNWDSLSTQLRAEGLIREQSSRFTVRSWMQIAAGITLAAGGAAVGRMTASSTPAVAVQSTAPAPQTASTSLASNTQAQFKSADEAWETLNRAGEEYQRASAFLSATNNAVPMPNNASQYRTRLATLDNVMTELRGAMKEAPQDPVINQYYVTTVGAREATLRQLGATLKPAGVSLNRF